MNEFFENQLLSQRSRRTAPTRNRGSGTGVLTDRRRTAPTRNRGSSIGVLPERANRNQIPVPQPSVIPNITVETETGPTMPTANLGAQGQFGSIFMPGSVIPQLIPATQGQVAQGSAMSGLSVSGTPQEGLRAIQDPFTGGIVYTDVAPFEPLSSSVPYIPTRDPATGMNLSEQSMANSLMASGYSQQNASDISTGRSRESIPTLGRGENRFLSDAALATNQRSRERSAQRREDRQTMERSQDSGISPGQRAQMEMAADNFDAPQAPQAGNVDSVFQAINEMSDEQMQALAERIAAIQRGQTSGEGAKVAQESGNETEDVMLIKPGETQPRRVPAKDVEAALNAGYTRA